MDHNRIENMFTIGFRFVTANSNVVAHDLTFGEKKSCDGVKAHLSYLKQALAPLQGYVRNSLLMGCTLI